MSHFFLSQCSLGRLSLDLETHACLDLSACAIVDWKRLEMFPERPVLFADWRGLSVCCFCISNDLNGAVVQLLIFCPVHY